MIIAVANSKTSMVWENIEISWEEFLIKVSNTTRTAESVEEYRAMPKQESDLIKDVGGFVGGSLLDGIRRGSNMEYRSLITLDMDYAPVDFWANYTVLYNYKSCIYSTHKHTPDKPRLRLILPLSRNVTSDEYVAISRRVAEDIGILYFDDTTYQAQRLMYWPSTSCDGEFIFESKDGPVLNPDEILENYSDWTDVSSYPVSSRQTSSVQQQADPLMKTGIIGAFCRVYSIEEVIEKYLSDIYEPSDKEGRYDYIEADSTAGLVVYDGKFAYSHHATDPAGGRLLNSFDLVKIHKFGEDGNEEMLEFCANDIEVKKQLSLERLDIAQADFAECEDWLGKLTYNKKGKIVCSLQNLIIILQNDEYLKNIVFNQLLDGLEIKGKLPWKHPSRYWRDADDSQMTVYIDNKYGSFSRQNYLTAMTKVTDDRSYHPVKEYLDSLPKWDNVERVETLLTEYLGAEDCIYTRQVIRKVLCAAVARIYKPGIKFDTMLVLVGAQGIGKSTLFSKLGMDWYSDSLLIADMKDKTGAEKLQGCWIAEVSELAGIRKVESETVRSFVSRQDDKYRASYGRRVEPHPRQCILVGSTNAKEGFLRDLTGNRRFLPVNVGIGSKKAWEMSKDEVGQIWAETLQYVKEGENIDLPDDVKQIAVEEQRKALESDDREGLIVEYLNMLVPTNWDNLSLLDRRNFIHNKDFSTTEIGTTKRKSICTMEIWCELFSKEASNLKRMDSYEINAILSKLNWLRKSDKLMNLPLYGKQRGYILEQE